MILFERNLIKKCIKSTYVGCDLFTEGLYTEAIKYFEKSIKYIHCNIPYSHKIPWKVIALSYEKLARSYLKRDASEEDRKMAVIVIQELLRMQKSTHNLRRIAETLILLREVCMGWGNTVSPQIRKREKIQTNFLFCLKEYCIQNDCLQESKLNDLQM